MKPIHISLTSACWMVVTSVLSTTAICFKMKADFTDRSSSIQSQNQKEQIQKLEEQNKVLDTQVNDLQHQLYFSPEKTTIEKPLSKPKVSKKAPDAFDLAVEYIVQFESFKPNAYPDPKTGNLPITIGYGSTVKDDGSLFVLGDTISMADAKNLLAKQLKEKYIVGCSKVPYWSEMPNNKKAALISFAYNLGANFYDHPKFSSLTTVLRKKQWDKVSNAFTLYCNPGSRVETGLRRRRLAEGQLWDQA